MDLLIARDYTLLPANFPHIKPRRCRTPKVNGVFRYSSTLAGIVGHKKSGSLVDENNSAALVEKGGEMSNFPVEELRVFEGIV